MVNSAVHELLQLFLAALVLTLFQKRGRSVVELHESSSTVINLLILGLCVTATCINGSGTCRLLSDRAMG